MKTINSLNIFSLEDASNPRKIGKLTYKASHKTIDVDFDHNWVKEGFSLDPVDTLVKPHAQFSTRGENISGYLSDSCPDEWGKHCIRFMDASGRFGPMELLYYAGHNRFGMLGFSLSDEYQPCDLNAVPYASSLGELSEVISRIRHSQPLTDYEKMVASSTKSLGGARPKMVVNHEGSEWIAKFPRDDYIDLSMVEFATNKLAQACGIKTADVDIIQDSPISHILLVKRFDREGDKRKHALSAGTLLGDSCNYVTMSELIHQRSSQDRYKADQRELFTRMAFNVFMDNTDDHGRNHAFIRENDGSWSLSPAFDMSIQGNGLMEQALLVGLKGSEGSIENMLSAHGRFSLSESEAVAILRNTLDVVSGWREFYQDMGLTSCDADMLSDSLNHDEFDSDLKKYETSSQKLG